MSSDIAIRVVELGKKYCIHHKGRNEGLRHVLQETIASPFRKIRDAFQCRTPRATLSHSSKTSTSNSQRTEEFWALKNVSFEIKRGEVVGIIGRNGAGKSTFLKVLSRITEPTTGRVEINGRVASLLEVGTGFHPELTGRENIYLNGAILGMSRTEVRSRFDEIVCFAEVERFLDTPVKRYSSGMYVRLAFAVAAHLEPEVLIVDEVLAVGDAQFQQKCLGRMHDVASAGRTVLFVSHNMAAVQKLCSRATLLRDGKVEADGVPSEVIPRFLSEASASETGEFDLRSHPLRAKGFDEIITRIRLLGENGRPACRLFPDETVTVELTMECKTRIVAPRIAIAIEDSYGRRIMTAASYFFEQTIPEISGRCMVSCSLGTLDLGAGRYLLSVSLGTRNSGLLDSLDGAAWFEMQWRDNYGNSEPYSDVYGPILKRSNWILRD